MKEIIQRGLDALNLSKKTTDKNSPAYEAEKEKARSEDPKIRKKLAEKATTRPEILYYLAGDDDVEVRKAVAKNRATPSQADIMLAKDGVIDVRLALAKRLMDLMPNISEEKQSQLYSYAVNSLATLARDEVLKVRLALSSTLKDKTYTPPQIASQLARDAEREVAEPMLQFCVMLSDDDLLEIISDHPSPWVLLAIATRDQVAETVTDALISTQDAPAGAALIKNEGAKFSKETLETVVEKAALIPSWQEPLVTKKSLPASLAEELAMFVDSSLLRYLEKRADYPVEIRDNIVSTVRRRIDFESKISNKGDSLQHNVLSLYKEGALDEEIIGDAIAWRQFEFVKLSLAVLAEVQDNIVESIVGTQAAKPIISLCWRAGLSMRMAHKIQVEMVRVQPKDVLLPRGGTDYPMSETDMNWQLDFFGVSDPKEVRS